MSHQVHWHEGLFLQPHHLQLLQRNTLEEGARNRQLLRSYHHGVIDMRLSADELANYRLRFDRLVVIMPSGLIVDFPNTADLPVIDLKPYFSSSNSGVQISIGVPLWQPKRQNAFAIGEPGDSRARILYKPVEVKVYDENSGENEKPVSVRRINARLLGDGDDFSDLETLPLLRIIHGVGDQLGIPKLDPEYVPPCVKLSGSAKLYQLVRDLTEMVRASRDELSVQINQGGFSLETMRGAQFEQFLRLRSLNRFSARLQAIQAAPSTGPFDCYLELADLYSELATLNPKPGEFDLPRYDHERLFIVFEELDSKVRGLLRGAVVAGYLKLDFQREPGLRSATLTEEHFTRPVEYFLAVKSKLDPREIVRIVEDPSKFKLMPLSYASKAVFGLGVKWEQIPPLQLPAKAGLTYFRVQRTGDTKATLLWEQTRKEKALVARWPEADVSDFDVTLYMTLP